jgi:hypothetical protein
METPAIMVVMPVKTHKKKCMIPVSHARVAYANTNVFNAHTPLRWDTGIMHFFLCVLTGITTMIAGVSMGAAVAKMVAWFDQYTDNIK